MKIYPQKYLKKTSGIFSIIRGKDLKTGDVTIPSTEALRVLSSDGSSSTVGTSKDDGGREFTSRHVSKLGSGVNNVIYGLHGEVEGHEFTDGS